MAHSIFGVAQAINTANYVYFRALEELGKLNNPAVLKIYTGWGLWNTAKIAVR